MVRTSRWLILLAAAIAAGCGPTNRPYLRDPLLHNGAGVRGDPTRPPPPPTPEPEPPPPPVDTPRYLPVLH